MYILITDPHFWSSSRKVVVEIITSQFFSLVVKKFFKAKTLSNSSFVVFLKASFVSMSFVSGFCYNIGFKWPDMSLTIEPEKSLTLWKKSFHLYGLNSFSNFYRVFFWWFCWNIFWCKIPIMELFLGSRAFASLFSSFIYFDSCSALTNCNRWYVRAFFCRVSLFVDAPWGFITFESKKLFQWFCYHLSYVKIFDCRLIMPYHFFSKQDIVICLRYICFFKYSIWSSTDFIISTVLSSPDHADSEYSVFILALCFILKKCSKTKDFNAVIYVSSSRKPGLKDILWSFYVCFSGCLRNVFLTDLNESTSWSFLFIILPSISCVLILSSKVSKVISTNWSALIIWPYILFVSGRFFLLLRF